MQVAQGPGTVGPDAAVLQLQTGLGQAVPRASSRELREALDALLADWAPRIERGRDDEMLRQQAPQ
ncbi:hypothetical protein KZ833_21240, partial [Pseudomonas aeruginosa]|nr:hypothetical protein [Pseudomonas aeruginosa]